MAPAAGTEWLVDEDLRRSGEAVMEQLADEGYARAWPVEWVRGIRAALADEDPVSPGPEDSTHRDIEEYPAWQRRSRYLDEGRAAPCPVPSRR